MIAAFFHDERFARDPSGEHRGTGAVPYRALARFLPHFERLIVVGRSAPPGPARRTVASGPGVEFACVDPGGLSVPRYAAAVRRRAAEVLAAADAAIVRLPSLVGTIACGVALRRGLPVLAEVVGDPFDALWNHGSWRGKAAALPLAAATRACLARVPFAVYVTREALQRRYPPGGAAIGISDVVIDAPDPTVLERRIARIRARTAGSPAVLGLVGSYDVGYKGHAAALRALALLRRAGREVVLRTVGPGDPARWRALATALGVGAHAQLGGALPHGSAVAAWMDSLDVFLAPSLQDGLPRALVEAMSRGLPAAGSRRGGIPELLPPEALARPGDPRDLASRVAALLDSPDCLREHALRSFAVAGEYTAAALEPRREAFLEEFAASIRPGRRRACAAAGARPHVATR